MTSRWLTDVAARRGIPIEWRALSLSLVHAEGDEVPGTALSTPEQVGFGFLRVIEHLASEQQFDAAARLYSAWGARVHDEGATPIAMILEESARAAGLSRRIRNVASDAALDDAVRRSTCEAVESAGPDVGSPVLVPPGATRGVFGPIMATPPTGPDALKLWDAVVTFTALDAVFELKHGRTVRRPVAKSA